jgi:peptidoglycan-associated lipoprotein
MIRRVSFISRSAKVFTMTKIKFLVAAAVMATALAGCGNRSNILPSDTSDGSLIGGGSSSSSGGAATRGAGAGSGIGVSALDAELQRLLDDLVIYFDFDRSEIRPDFNAMLAAHGQYLATNPNAQVRLEGHADERGSREYNIGLGERRAQAVRRILLLQGASASQLNTVSYGEERPAVFGSDEESYTLNRRVELVYRQ